MFYSGGECADTYVYVTVTKHVMFTRTVNAKTGEKKFKNNKIPLFYYQWTSPIVVAEHVKYMRIILDKRPIRDAIRANAKRKQLKNRFRPTLKSKFSFKFKMNCV